MTETAKERIYRKAFEEIKRVCDNQDHVDNDLLRFFITKKMMEIENLPVTTDKLIPDYWIVSGQVFKNKERFVKQQMEFNPGDIRENWESSFDHFAIPVYRNPIFVSEYENGVKVSFVRKNKVLQEQLNTAKKALTEIAENENVVYRDKLYRRFLSEIARKALNELGENDEI